MIDTHSYILPGLGNGPERLSQALEMVRIASEQGVRAMFATPRTRDGAIAEVWQSLNQAVIEADIPVQVLPGSEIPFSPNLIGEFDAGRLVPLGCGSHVLLGLPDRFMTAAVVVAIRQFRERGATPIIARAEKNAMIMHKPDLVLEFAHAGARLQVTAPGLAGVYGKASLKTANALIGAGAVFCIGSDARPGNKYLMSQALKKTIRLSGRQTAYKIFKENPLILMDGSHGFSNELKKAN